MPVLNSILDHHDVSAIVAAFAGAVTRDDPSVVEPRIGVMFIILFISLFAVSFPGVSKQIAFLRIPHILFFIGKHFGTGVILATAFIHLLSDAFESLQRPVVKEQYHNIGKWTGLIILSSLLIIFLVEYISTSYVDHLQADPSAPPSPICTPASSRPRSRTRSSRPGSSKRLLAIEPVNEHTPLLTASPSPLSHTPTPPAQAIPVIPSHVPPKPHISHAKTTPAAKPFPPKRAQSLSYLPPSTRPHPLSNSRNIHNLSFYSNSHNTHAHIFHPGHLHHHPAPSSLIPIDILTNTPRLIRGTTGGGVCVCVVGEDSAVSSRGVSASKSVNMGSRGRSGRPVRPGEEEDDVGSSEGSQIMVEREEEIPRVGRRRQVVGILVLQLGIMIHSLVIGLTLAITNGADFTSLTTAIIFHQLFEGLSLGIRIAALPPAKEPLSLSSPPLSTSQHSHSPLANSHSHSRSSPTLIPSHHSPSPSHEQRHHAGWWRWPKLSSWHPNWLKWTLSILFAITTPFGMGVGMVVFASKGRSQHDVARMYLTQGLMSAISAGMLIYAATVEVIAGDFVFGDVAGHSHSHGHSHGGGFDTEDAFSDAEDVQSALSDDEDEQHPQGHAHAHMHEPGHSQKHHPERIRKRRRQSGSGSTNDVEEAAKELEGRDGRLRKKVLAVCSLLAGVGGMVLIGLAE
ncbi:ZIP zinc transporter-domain-containing protein [Crucibulum laeve]|uniref:ZIP zinc transporter-domain-containing protein n=1 Tax=Crucibulum laeve TaxID=68775 RepID=A0A5C3LZD8_9AGAR|nr:ZIP zinc transporter-domain-containing protein [Crucibulum laeve]